MSNSNELTINEQKNIVLADKPLTIDEVLAKSRLVRDVVVKVMKKGQHYDTIPGCGQKSCLLQAGAQQLGVTFNLCANPVILDTVNTPEEYSVTIKVDLCSSSGICVASAIGRASSREEKYHWRKSVCDEEFSENPENKRRIKWKKGWNGSPATKEYQIMVNPADVANTVLKIANKRAYVAAILNATAASDQFTQDIEDMQRELFNEDETRKNNQRDHQEKPQDDQQRQQAIKKIVAAIKKSCGNDTKKMADAIKALFPKKGLNDCTSGELAEAQKKLDAQSSKVPAGQPPLPNMDNEPWAGEKFAQPQGQQSQSILGNGKEKLIRNKIRSKLEALFPHNQDAQNDWLASLFVTTLDGLDTLGVESLQPILDDVEKLFAKN